MSRYSLSNLCINIFYLDNSLEQYYSKFADGRTEAKREKATCLSSHNLLDGELRIHFNPDILVSEFMLSFVLLYCFSFLFLHS